MQRIAADKGNDSESRAAAEKATAEDIKNFTAGHSVVAEHGKLTETGQALMDRAEAFMRAAA